LIIFFNVFKTYIFHNIVIGIFLQSKMYLKPEQFNYDENKVHSYFTWTNHTRWLSLWM